jgi:inhibitor of KinA sporulation pathway (predicted exonuclease)
MGMNKLYDAERKDGKMGRNHNKIVLDFEFNPIADQKARLVSRHEIIEIGAVKLDKDNKTTDKFQKYIKPQYNTVTPMVTSITGITDATLADCGSFDAVLCEFVEWIGNEPFRIYSWSGTDQTVLTEEILLKLGENSAEGEFFGGHWVDLQKIYQRIMGFEKSMGLSNALGTLMIHFKGKEHGALADAVNTAEVMKVLYDGERIDKLKNHSAVTYNGNTHSGGGFTMGSLFADQFAKLGR